VRNVGVIVVYAYVREALRVSFEHLCEKFWEILENDLELFC
jgi:hypothetical protein